MSSARKRAAIQKANNEADFLRQRLMRAEHHASVMQSFAEVACRRGDALYAAIQKHQAETRYAEVSNTLADRTLYQRIRRRVRDGLFQCPLPAMGLHHSAPDRSHGPARSRTARADRALPAGRANTP